jgi:Protein of unknown function (DUF3021).
MWYCFSYTLGVISLSIWGIVRGGTKAQFSGLILLNIALVLIAVQVIDAVCARFIHKLVPFLIVDCVVITASLTAFYIAIGWISFNFWSITCCAATIAVTFGIVYAYVFKKNKADSQEINRKLKIQNEQNGIK